MVDIGYFRRKTIKVLRVWHLRIQFLQRQVELGKNVQLGLPDAEGRNRIGDNAVLFGDIKIGYGTTVGRDCTLHGGNISLGRYCQLGPCVALYATNHPFNHLTSYVNENLLAGIMKKYGMPGNISIGSDVWIGHGAILLSDLKVGDGAVIGAGAVVTRDVPPYAIVAGNPAQLIRYRFSDEIIQMLLELEWWNLPPFEIESHKSLFDLNLVQDPERALKEIKESLHKK